MDREVVDNRTVTALPSVMHTDRIRDDDLVHRRDFIKTATLLSAGLLGDASGLMAAQEKKEPYRAAIIGHTGHGNFGHELDLIFAGNTKVEVVAVADADEAGRRKAAERAGAPRQYADYNVMIEREKPQLVCVAPRWTDEHYAMIRTALASGAHVISEKPFTQTLAQADELLELADRRKLKIAVAHQMRLAPGILHLHSALRDGIIGDLVEIRAYGKQYSRAGGEDMLVLGVHLFDLMRFFAGDPQWCFARVLSKGHEITRADARKVAEGIGLVAGDDIHAEFGFNSGVTGFFTSTASLRETIGHWGLELVCSKAVVRILADVFPRILIRKSAAWTDQGRSDQWSMLDGDPTANATTAERGFGPANRRVLDDWIAAIEQGREPICSGRAAAKALEMVMSVYASALARNRVTLPLARRTSPLES